MKVLIAFFAALAVVKAGIFSHSYGAIRVRFDVNFFGYGTSSFIEIPITRDGAIAENWTLEEGPDNPNYKGLSLYCYLNKIVCIIVDSTGNFRGLQIALPKDDFKNCDMFDDAAVMRSRGYDEWTSTVDGILRYFFAIAFFTSDPAATETSAENCTQASSDDNTILKNDAIWVQGPGGLMKIPTKEADIKAEGIFTKQARIIWMGQHYYYKMSTTTECTSNNLFPWFPLTDYGKLVAVGLMNFGKFSPKSSERNWFENPGRLAVKVIVPRGPECLYDLVDKCSMTTIHIYFIKNPLAII